jgi:hypothetical protein
MSRRGENHVVSGTDVIVGKRAITPRTRSCENREVYDNYPSLDAYLYGDLGRANIRGVELQQLAEEYQRKTDEELLRLALDRTQLTPEASSILNDELSRRRINTTERLGAFSTEEEQRKEEQRNHVGRLFVIHPYGIGRKRFGKAERVYNSETGMERFRTTVFVVLLWLPLIPTGTFLVERKRAFLSNQMTVLKRMPLDWEQVLKVWVVASASLLALICIFKSLSRLLYRG